jgi:dolichol-phosphate mannosyltransferase
MTSKPSTFPVLADPISPGPAASSFPSRGTLPRTLTALPVYNEQAHVATVLSEVKKYATDILVVDDGSTDGTAHALAQCPGVVVVRHPRNLGYGAALQTAFQYAQEHRYEVLLTIDCDGQHEPQRIGGLVEACRGSAGDSDSSTRPSTHQEGRADIVSGSRYLVVDESTGPPPEARRQINQQITQEINQLLGLQLTDAFCGFKAYRVDALAQLHLTEMGYAMPLELWVQAAHHGLRIVERPVPLVYLDESRSFGGALDDAATRLAHYRVVIERAIRNCTIGNGAINNGAGQSSAPPQQQAPRQPAAAEPAPMVPLQTASRQPDPAKSPSRTPTRPAATFLSVGCGPCS